jgi:hypothetical protein
MGARGKRGIGGGQAKKPLKNKRTEMYEGCNDDWDESSDDSV